MAEAVALHEQRRSTARRCRHHWIIETPHGVTSRGHCKRCGATKRFPNAAEDARWEPAAGLGRWSSRRGTTRPTEIKRPGSDKER